MRRLAEVAEAIAATTKKTEKVRLLSDYFRSYAVEEAAAAAVFLSGRPFPANEETTLQVGGRLLWRVVADASGQTESALGAAYRRHGDLGAATYDVFRAAAKGRTPDPRIDVAELPSKLNVLQVAKAFREIASARGPAAKVALVRDLLARATPLEAKYLVKIMTGELRIGLKESLVEEAIAAAYPCGEASGHEDPKPGKRFCLQQVQRANMLLGDIGETLRLAAANRLSQARMRLLHPIGFMLASPVESAREAFDFFQHAQVEDKYDGIRAQVHVSGGELRIFSRTLDEVSESFPDLIEPLLSFADDVILDGEILAWDFDVAPGSSGPVFAAHPADPKHAGHRTDTANARHSTDTKHAGHPERSEGSMHFAPPRTIGRALPFSALQKRLGRKRPTSKIMREVPVAYVVFDVLYAGGELVIDRPLGERAALLDALFTAQPTRASHARKQRIAVEDAQGALQFEPVILSRNDDSATDHRLTTNHEPPLSAAVIRAPVLRADSEQHLSELFELAQARGNEGLMIKDINSPYTPGRRGRSWVKLKRELATLDVVVTAVERGHGRRVDVLSDYTFAVRDPNGRPEEDLPQTANGEPLLNIGKAYSGLTDVEIAQMTEWFEQHTIEDQGWVRQVEPKIVIEVAFNAVMRSDRHNSGYALRFPRILRLRPDKAPEQADTLDRLREIFERQQELPLSA